MTDYSSGFRIEPTDTVQTALERAGSAITMLWKTHAPAPAVPVVQPEFTDWEQEQQSWNRTVAFLDLSHHMTDLFIDGPDAVTLLARVSANNYEKFAVGQAKQFIAVSHDGWLIQDAILARVGENSFVLTGIGTAHNWVAYHAAAGGDDVSLEWDYSSDIRRNDTPRLFRYQVQGPNAPEMLQTLFGDALDDIAFFHLKDVQLEGRPFQAIRHGMAGQPGFEFTGPWEHAEFVKDALLRAGEPVGLVQVGGRAYYTTGVDSGWLAAPVPAVYHDDAEKGFRSSVSIFSYEGMSPIQGSFYSPDIVDYYVNPYEVGYGRSIHLDHDFVGRDALRLKKEDVRRKKVTLIWNAEDVDRVFGADRDLILSYTKDRVEKDGELVGISEYAASSAAEGTVHSIARVDTAHAEPGTELVLRWGFHPGPADPGFDEFESIRVVVAPSPYNEYARQAYRAEAQR